MIDNKTTRSFIAVTLYESDQTVYIRHTDICALYQQYAFQDRFMRGTFITFYDKERSSIHVRENANEVSNMIFNAENSWYIREAME